MEYIKVVFFPNAFLSRNVCFDLLSKQKWDEEDFEGEMEEDFDDDLAEEGLPTGHEAVAPGKGILLLPHRQLHPHAQLLKVRPSLDQEPHVAILPPHATHSHLGGQDHGEWTYEEQFRQVGCLHSPQNPLWTQNVEPYDPNRQVKSDRITQGRMFMKINNPEDPVCQLIRICMQMQMKQNGGATCESSIAVKLANNSSKGS